LFPGKVLYFYESCCFTFSPGFYTYVITRFGTVEWLASFLLNGVLCGKYGYAVYFWGIDRSSLARVLH
jgi:hypothetical protein